jgi:DNA-binding MarR family transcriptional regulator
VSNTGRTDIKPGHFAALVVIDCNPGIGQGGLGRAIARDKSTVTPLIQHLQRRGLIEIRRSPRDGRRVNLMITPEGKRLLRRVRRHAELHDRKLDAIVGEDKAKFIGLLRKIANDLS